MEEVGVGLEDLLIPLVHQAFVSQEALEFIGQAPGQIADAWVSGLGVLGREEDRAAAEMYVLDLNPHELPDPAAQFINDLKHQLVTVLIDAVEELLQFILCQVADDLAETLVSSGSSRLSACVVSHGGRFVGVDGFHANVKSHRYKSLASCIAYMDTDEP